MNLFLKEAFAMKNIIIKNRRYIHENAEASVSSGGVVAGKKVGRSTITVSLKSNPDIKAQCILTVGCIRTKSAPNKSLPSKKAAKKIIHSTLNG